MKKLRLIILIIVMIIFMYVPICYGAGATVDTNIKNVKPGGTVELNIMLSVESTGYDIKIEPSNKDLVEKSEIVSKIGEENTSRIYLVQLAKESERKQYAVGTKILTIRYTISSSAQIGSALKFNVTGDIAGKSSDEKNTVNESVIVNITKESDPEPSPSPTTNPTTSPTTNPSQSTSPLPSSSQSPSPTTSSSAKPTESNDKTNAKTTIAGSDLPYTGLEKLILIFLMIILVIMSITSFILYKRTTKKSK